MEENVESRPERMRTFPPVARRLRFLQRTPTYCLPAIWDFRRQGWMFRSGGDGPDKPPEAGFIARLTEARPGMKLRRKHSKGFPKKPYGRIAVAIAPSNREARLCLCRIDRQRALRIRRWRRTWDRRDKSTWMVGGRSILRT